MNSKLNWKKYVKIKTKSPKSVKIKEFTVKISGLYEVDGELLKLKKGDIVKYDNIQKVR
jgi:hypothetical protein